MWMTQGNHEINQVLSSKAGLGEGSDGHFEGSAR